MKIITASKYRKELTKSRGSIEKNAQLDEAVLAILSEVRKNGDEALRRYTEQFDLVSLDTLRVSDEEFQEAKGMVSPEFIAAMEAAKENIASFHQEQKEHSWFTQPQSGVMLGQKVTPLSRVGIYIPGGKAAYPSTVFMNALPAKIAGVLSIIITTPPQKNGKVNPHVLVAAEMAGVNEVYKVGGAQAIAALAYGTETISKVNKIVGPGNAFVARAKKWVYGEVAIDMIAGPSEICVVADRTCHPSFAAADLLSQAEHDEEAAAICIVNDEETARLIDEEVNKQLAALERKQIAEKSIETNGRIVIAADLTEAFELVNLLAPEHLEIMTENPMEQLQFVQNAGAIFLGDHSPEVLGDYFAGPNHTLPTSGTAAFASPLGIYDFMKKSSIIHYSQAAFSKAADSIATIAKTEGLGAHARAAEIRKAASKDR
ncbi:histidinol dehydrogenase [Virgibacillus sp. 179-BFC.A HS]|uniref:Histidinol dehydrogenase n=1 Tax=Tigheibacillus jepli TaxID=3035914 RepID=A0ABU5CKD7_9BACI|nr:histidinol dehydrogenase [Virgibacillus sp. 179-BFC.A HS]MDY0406819.1 histidinol dehydrogenase [Virgibacillus sp. 179-BFC.A HS]